MENNPQKRDILPIPMAISAIAILSDIGVCVFSETKSFETFVTMLTLGLIALVSYELATNPPARK